MNNIKILIVEDEIVPEGIALRDILTSKSYNVVKIAGTYEEAIKFSEVHKPEIIIMDISLNGDHFAGIKAAEEIKGKLNTHIIYLTGVERSVELLQKANNTNPFGFLIKPLDEEQLLTTVKQASLIKPDNGNQVFPPPHKKNIIIIADIIEDKENLDVLKKHLTILRQNIWHSGMILTGENVEQKIKENVQKADLAILFLTINYTNSDRCLLMEERVFANSNIRVVPILVEPVYWQLLPFYEKHRIEPLPRNLRPISDDSWNNQQAAYFDIMRELVDLLK